jgi:transposase
VAAVRGGQDLRPRLRPGHRYYTDVKQRYDANRAALSQARRIVRQAHILTALGDDAFTATTVAHTPSSTVVTR